MTAGTIPRVLIAVSDEQRLRMSDKLEEVLGHDATGTLLRSLSRHGTVKPRTDADVIALFERLHEVMGPEDADVLIALLPLEPFRRRAAESATTA